ncbi:hypothetical protein AN619_09680 [Thermotalea metallivorans]|uniref:Uncharacterized protein n=1 Tax=Thermotalea metallivorans TaxID=520762 RepID=A0A140L7B2_9FIRM|nr:hypothetical protein AN619_09680 [Thermotalea metallivorans]
MEKFSWEFCLFFEKSEGIFGKQENKYIMKEITPFFLVRKIAMEMGSLKGPDFFYELLSKY